MELQFRGIQEEEKEYIPILPSWAYSIEEIKTLLNQFEENVEQFNPIDI